MAAAEGSQRPKYAKRLTKELEKLQQDPPTYLAVDLVKPDDPLHWKLTISGPADTPWEGGKFQVDLQLTQDYPIQVPTVRFLTRIYHPNVDAETGQICQNIIEKDWSPVLKVKDVAERLFAMLKNPQGEHPVHEEVGRAYNSDRAAFNQTAKQWTKKYAR